MHVKVRQTCRLCGSNSLTPILNLGAQVLASAFAAPDAEVLPPTRKVPLDLVRCNPEKDEDACGLVQLRHTYPSDIMYGNYWYASGINQTMRDALADVTRRARDFVSVQPGDVAVDIGCNDGTLLRSYGDPALDLVGFDPAQNFVGMRDEGFQRVSDYFSADAYVSVRGEKKARIVTSIAMFYDIEEPIAFCRQIESILADDGVWVLQMADLPNMLRHNMFDNICHEHLTYYHMAPVEYLLKRAGLKLVDVEMNFVNGSSYRFFVRKASGPAPTPDAQRRIARTRIDEFNLALDSDIPYQRFSERIERNRNDLLFFINQERSRGKTILVYGASTKGNVLLQYCGLSREQIPFAVDRNPRKWGTTTLGSDIPIISEEEARKMRPDYFLVLPYHFLDEMLRREHEFIALGGRFIVPVPTVKLVPE